MIKLWEYLCEQNHVFLAVGYDDSVENGAAAKEALKHAIMSLVAKEVIGDFCVLCNSKQFHIAERSTDYKTVQEAYDYESEQVKIREEALLKRGDIYQLAGGATLINALRKIRHDGQAQ